MSYQNLVIYIEGIFYINQNNKFQEFSFKGGKIPLNNSHSVIESPELVNLVKPPTIIIKKTIINDIINQ